METYGGYTVEELQKGEEEGWISTTVLIQYLNGESDQDLENENI